VEAERREGHFGCWGGEAGEGSLDIIATSEHDDDCAISFGVV
jgi:hypothetical protein